tara:strand:+ start:15 stop:437 length:423 start_codon:yes stop_codon:yes gene_type:complete
MIKNSSKILCLVPLFLLLINCNRREKLKKVQKENVVMEKFDVFYNEFHSDSLFQMSRIKFPLQGQNIDGFKKNKWTKVNWVLLKTKIYDIDTLEFKTRWEKSATSFVQKCYLEHSGFSSEYRFQLIKKKWYLTYALDITI